MAASTQGVSNGVQQAQGRLLGESAVTKEQGDVLIGVTCMFLTLCLAAVGGRLLARRMVKASLEADDYLTVGALVGKNIRRYSYRNNAKTTIVVRSCS